MMVFDINHVYNLDVNIGSVDIKFLNGKRNHVYCFITGKSEGALI